MAWLVGGVIIGIDVVEFNDLQRYVELTTRLLAPPGA